MSDNSPLFISAIELLSHATELSSSGDSKKYKFVILHLANSVELLLKDCLIDHGISIYKKNTNTTISVWSSFDELEKINIQIQEKPIIELLIDDRNTIQHRFGFPNIKSVIYYLYNVVSFFKRFLEEQYKINLEEILSEYLSKENLVLIGLVPDDYAHLRKLFKLSPEAAIQQANAMIEKKLADLINSDIIKVTKKPLYLNETFKLMQEQGLIKEDVADRFSKVYELRNLVTHNAKNMTSSIEIEKGLEIAIDLLKLLNSILPEG